ncbi:glycosyltransferase family 4 protein [Solibacillus silvestris]|uniref:glycosyltransferase family 4 protein n=1 Tax=Solibacillus silvestris TaxID=76853 RepID=UPI003F7CFEDA
MKEIWIIAPFTGIEENNFRNRFTYLANLLTEEGYNITLITSQFSHFQKSHIISETLKYPFKTVLLYEKGYKKNVSLSRILSHKQFSKQLGQWMNNKNNKPDLLYVAYPTMTAANVASKYAKNHNIPIVLDVQDTWPESISAAVDIKKWYYKLPLAPLTWFANNIYKSVDGIIAVSKTYMNRARVLNSRSQFFKYIYIGSDLNTFDNMELNGKIMKNNGDFWITYIGTLSHSYDIETAIKAIKMFNSNIILNILGDGPDFDRLKNIAVREGLLNSQVFFKGYLPYEEMLSYLKQSDVALNAIIGSSKATITNKLGDYLAAGLPILNSCEESEIVKLVEEKQLGLNYKSEEIEDLFEKIENLIIDQEKRLEFSKNAREFAEESFDRKNSYKKIEEAISMLLDGKLEVGYDESINRM